MLLIARKLESTDLDEMSVERQLTEAEIEVEMRKKALEDSNKELLTLKPMSTNFVDDLYLWYRRVFHGDSLSADDLKRILLEPPQYPQQDYELVQGRQTSVQEASLQQQLQHIHQLQEEGQPILFSPTSTKPVTSVFELNRAQSIPHVSSPILASGGFMRRPSYSQSTFSTPTSQFYASPSSNSQQKLFADFLSPTNPSTTAPTSTIAHNFLTSPQPSTTQPQQPHFPMEFSSHVSKRFGVVTGDFQSGLFNGIPK